MCLSTGGDFAHQWDGGMFSMVKNYSTCEGMQLSRADRPRPTSPTARSCLCGTLLPGLGPLQGDTGCVKPRAAPLHPRPGHLRPQPCCGEKSRSSSPKTSQFSSKILKGTSFIIKIGRNNYIAVQIAAAGARLLHRAQHHAAEPANVRFVTFPHQKVKCRSFL